jgi:stage V sporulation protein R
MDSYIEDPSIGIEKVERILDSAHALSLHIPPNCKEYIPHRERRKELITRIKSGDPLVINRNPDQFPIDDEIDLLSFISEMALNLEDWERDIINIVRLESAYFMPQIRTKIMNEGWACFWHYRLMNELDLPQKFHIPFLKSHNQVVTPHLGRINPYHLGFHLFLKIEERYGLEECFIAREVCHDESFLRQYLTEEDCHELNLFSYSLYKRDYVVNEISDGDGWKEIKKSLIRQIGSNSVPKIIIKEVKSNNVLRIHHEHDGRDLELGYAEKVVDYITTLWGGVVRLDTVIEDEPFEI